MSTPLDSLELLVVKEDQIVQRIHTYEEIIAIVLDMVYKQGDIALHIVTVHEALISILRLQQDMQAELLYLRLEKRILAHTNTSAYFPYPSS